MAKLSVELQRYFLEEERSPKVILTEVLQRVGARIICTSLPGAGDHWNCDRFDGHFNDDSHPRYKYFTRYLWAFSSPGMA